MYVFDYYQSIYRSIYYPITTVSCLEITFSTTIIDTVFGFSLHFFTRSTQDGRRRRLADDRFVARTSTHAAIASCGRKQIPVSVTCANKYQLAVFGSRVRTPMTEVGRRSLDYFKVYLLYLPQGRPEWAEQTVQMHHLRKYL